MGIFLFVSVCLAISMVGMGVTCFIKGIKGEKVKKFMGINVTSLFGMLVVAVVFILTGGVPASAETVDPAAVAASSDGLRFIAAALSTGLAGIGAGIAVSATGSAALGALSEDPKILGKALVFVGLAEGIAIYGLIISIMILNS